MTAETPDPHNHNLDQSAELYTSEERGRIESIVEFGRNGVLPLRALRPSDRLTIHTYTNQEGHSYRQEQDRILTLDITTANPEITRAQVLHDTYNDIEVERPESSWALPEEAEITLLGAWDHTTERFYARAFHRARGLTYQWRRKDGAYTAPISTIVFGRGDVTFAVYHQDVSRAPSPPTDAYIDLCALAHLRRLD